MGFSRQEYWSGLPFPSPGDLPDLGVESGSPTFQVDSLPPEPPGLGKGLVCREFLVEGGSNSVLLCVRPEPSDRPDLSAKWAVGWALLQCLCNLVCGAILLFKDGYPLTCLRWIHASVLRAYSESEIHLYFKILLFSSSSFPCYLILSKGG